MIQVSESITKQEQLVSQVQDLYQPFIQERGGAGSDRETALKALAQVQIVNWDIFFSLLVLALPFSISRYRYCTGITVFFNCSSIRFEPCPFHVLFLALLLA